MGVYIFLDILPHNIDKKDWENVYEESLALINAYPFMDNVVDKETYGVPWRYVQRPKESMMDFRLDDSYLGWHVFGDYHTMLAAESFALIKDLDRYRSSVHDQEGSDDILAELINRERHFDKEHQKIPVAQTSVFDGKTQGYPHHIYLLAVACLIESRFPKQAYVWGDISIAQMEKAVDWANTILQQPIQIPERINQKTLLKRLRNIVQDDVDALRSFMAITKSKEDLSLGDFIREQFDSDTITVYFTKEFKGNEVETFGFLDLLKKYFNLGFSVEDACDICVLNVNGCRYDPKIFVDAVLSMNWADENDDLKGEIPLSYNDPGSEEPETVHSQFGKMMLKMAGFQESVESNKTHGDVVTALQEKLGGIVDIESHLQDDDEDDTNHEDNRLLGLLSDLENKYENTEEPENAIPTYTIRDLDDLILWKEGDTLQPDIEKSFKPFQEFVAEFIEDEAELIAAFNKSTEREKIQKLIKANRYFNIKKETWDYYFENINQTNLIHVLYSIFHVNADGLNTNKLCKAFVNNVNLLKKYIVQQI